MNKRNSIVCDTFSMNTPELNSDKVREFMINDSGTGGLKGGRSLLTRIAASHWGYINKNGFFYDPETVDGSLPTWTTPYKKPILTYHPKAEDKEIVPIGRIIAATYKEGVARNYIEDNAIKDNVPHGYLEFMTRVSDEGAIPKVLDGRYDTVSISAIAVDVRCSICNDVVSKDTCEHQRFSRYNQDGERDKNGDICYYTAGPLLGRHLAFVVTPSDIYAGVKNAEFEEDISDSISVQRAFMESPAMAHYAHNLIRIDFRNDVVDVLLYLVYLVEEASFLPILSYSGVIQFHIFQIHHL